MEEYHTANILHGIKNSRVSAEKQCDYQKKKITYTKIKDVFLITYNIYTYRLQRVPQQSTAFATKRMKSIKCSDRRTCLSKVTLICKIKLFKYFIRNIHLHR